MQQLSAMYTCRDGKGGELTVTWPENVISRNGSSKQIAGSCLFTSQLKKEFE